MNFIDGAQSVLEKILGNLELDAEVQQAEYADGPLLEIHSDDSRYIIGRGGERLDDLQYLVNRIVQKHAPDSPRVRVDCNGYRAESENRLISQAKALAEEVVATGESREMKPLNAYHRRIIHNALVESAVSTESEEGSKRFKKVFILPQNS